MKFRKKIPQNIWPETIYHEIFLSWCSRFFSLPLTLCYNSSTRFPELVRPIFLLLDDFLCSHCDLSMEYFDTNSLLVSIMGLIVFLVFLIFYLCVELNTSLQLYHSFMLFWPPVFKIAPFCVPEKITWNLLYVKQQKWKYQIYFEADR